MWFEDISIFRVWPIHWRFDQNIVAAQNTPTSINDGHFSAFFSIVQDIVSHCHEKMLSDCYLRPIKQEKNTSFGKYTIHGGMSYKPDRYVISHDIGDPHHLKSEAAPAFPDF